MKTSAWLALAGILIVLIAGILIFSGNIFNKPNENNNLPSPEVNPGTGSKFYKIDITNFKFVSSALTIKSGDSVIWTNKDSAPHSVTSDSGSELDSATLNKGETYQHTFATAGTYNYYCKFHTGMKAKIIAE